MAVHLWLARISLCVVISTLPVQLLAAQYPGVDDKARFIRLVRENALEEVRRLLDTGVDPDTHGLDNQTALMIAAHHGYLDMMKMLIEAGAGLDSGDVGGSSVLAIAVRAKKPDSVALLLDSGARISGLNTGGEKAVYRGFEYTRPNERAEALQLASCQPDTRLLELLLQAGVNPDEKEGENGRTALMMSAGHGDAAKVERLLSAGADPNLRDDHDHAALHYVLHGSVLKQAPQNRSLVIRKLVEVGGMPAPDEVAHCYAYAIADDDLEFAEFLVNRGIGPNVPDGGDGSPLMIAVAKDRPELVRMLLQHGADPNWRNGKGETAVMHALRNPPTFLLLQEHGADLSATDARGWSVLRYALAADRDLSEDIFAQVAESSGNSEEIRKSGGMYLHWVINNGKTAALAVLVSRGADTEVEYAIMNTPAYTPLQRALQVSNNKAAGILLKGGADPDHVPAGTESPLLMAAKKNNREILVSLLKAGADPNRLSGNNRTALQEVYFYRDKAFHDMVLALLDAGARADIGSPVANEMTMSNACRYGDLKLVRGLYKAGASVNAGKDSSTPSR